MATVAEAVALGERILPRRPGLPDPRREALWLLARATGVEELRLRVEPAAPVDPGALATYRRWLERRASGEPAHHLVGECPFWGRAFYVSPAVLIPRPETELVVEAALGAGLSSSARALDVGTGSGCLAVTLAAERPGWQVVATERSPSALAVARTNVARHGVDIALVATDLAAPLAATFDLVVANLPYIPTRGLSLLPLEVLHDPSAALDGGRDGLDLVRALLGDLPRLLRPGGLALLELGEGQADEVVAAARRLGLEEASRIRDAGGAERVLALRSQP